MRSTGIKVWVLTGDKVETAVNIGYSSELLEDDNKMDKLYLTESIMHLLEAQVSEAFETLSKNENKKALIVSGDALILLFTNPELK